MPLVLSLFFIYPYIWKVNMMAGALTTILEYEDKDCILVNWQVPGSLRILWSRIVI